MAVKEREEVGADPGLEPVGVPMGGVGAGCIEMGQDGRFRNITINNNRTSDTRIPVSPGSFLAVRASRRGKVSTRLLQADSAVPFQQAGVTAPYTADALLGWRGLYPCARYHLNEPRFPLEVHWRAFAPVIPFDLDASTLPVLYLTVEITNPTDDVYEAAAVLNWENLRGCVRGLFPEDRGSISPIPLALTRPSEKQVQENESARKEGAPPAVIGLEFGSPEARTNAEGHYCLVALPARGVETSVCVWDERDTSDVADFWQDFHYEGFLGNRIAETPAAHSGAVCASTQLGPRARHPFVFILTWFCPRFEVNGVDLGNAYASTYRNAWEVALRAIKYYGYYANAVDNWQKRLLSSSLPPWFSKMLINSNYVFSTNTLLTGDGRFAMMETPEDPVTGSLDRRFHSSLGTLLFFPELEHREMAEFRLAVDPKEPGRIYRHLGRLTVHEPGHGDRRHELMDINPKFVLMACRDYFMTGRRAPAERIYPRLKQALDHVLSRDRDNDGLPEQEGISTTFDDWAIYGVNSYTSSLWLAALRAFTRLAAALNHPEDARRYDQILEKATRRFEECLWISEKGYYRVYCDTDEKREKDTERQDGCHSGQLAGQWYADFLSLGHLFPPERIASALEAMWQLNEVPLRERRKMGAGSDASPTRRDLSWPAFYATQCACLHIYHRRANRGLHGLYRIYQDLHGNAARSFCQPLSWDNQAGRPAGWGMDRHMSAPAVWHVLYAVEGFFLDIPNQTLWIRPNLPGTVNSLSAPLFTPSCLGWLDFQLEEKGPYVQRVRVSFDSPIRVKTVVLRIPPKVADVRVRFTSPAGPEETDHYLGYDGDDHLVEIVPKNPVLMNGPTTIILEGSSTPPQANA